MFTNSVAVVIASLFAVAIAVVSSVTLPSVYSLATLSAVVIAELSSLTFVLSVAVSAFNAIA